MSSTTAVAGFIWGEMAKNVQSDVAKEIAKLLRTDEALDFIGLPFHFYQACQLWKSRVGNRRPWDYKRPIREMYGEWSFDEPSRRDYNFDVWSNLHYGYVGRGVGFGLWTLKAGAGGAQYQAGTSPKGYWERRTDKLGDADFLAAFDDPKDQAAIEAGAELWDSFGAAVTLANTVDVCGKFADRLNTRRR